MYYCKMLSNFLKFLTTLCINPTSLTFYLILIVKFAVFLTTNFSRRERLEQPLTICYMK